MQRVGTWMSRARSVIGEQMPDDLPPPRQGSEAGRECVPGQALLNAAQKRDLCAF